MGKNLCVNGSSSSSSSFLCLSGSSVEPRPGVMARQGRGLGDTCPDDSVGVENSFSATITWYNYLSYYYILIILLLSETVATYINLRLSWAVSMSWKTCLHHQIVHFSNPESMSISLRPSLVTSLDTFFSNSFVAYFKTIQVYFSFLSLSLFLSLS